MPPHSVIEYSQIRGFEHCQVARSQFAYSQYMFPLWLMQALGRRYTVGESAGAAHAAVLHAIASSRQFLKRLYPSEGFHVSPINLRRSRRVRLTARVHACAECRCMCACVCTCMLAYASCGVFVCIAQCLFCMRYYGREHVA